MPGGSVQLNRPFMSDKYNDGVLDAQFQRIEELMDAHFSAHTEILSDIKTQTTKTNGRVTTVEKLIWTSLGALPLLTVWSGWMTVEILHGKEQISPIMEAAIEQSVYKAFKEYDITPE